MFGGSEEEQMEWFWLPLLALGMFWLATFDARLAAARNGGDLFDFAEGPQRLASDASWQIGRRRRWLLPFSTSVLILALIISLVLMGPPYLAARSCLWCWRR